VQIPAVGTKAQPLNYLACNLGWQEILTCTLFYGLMTVSGKMFQVTRGI
jgi:hypothetical protein